MSDFVHAIPQSSVLIPQRIEAVGANASGRIPQVTTNYQPTGNKPLSGGRAALAVVLVFIFAGTALYYRYQQRIDAFFGESGKRPVVVKARPPAKMSKLDQAEGRPTVEPQLPSATKYRQDVATYRVRSKDQLSYGTWTK